MALPAPATSNAARAAGDLTSMGQVSAPGPSRGATGIVAEPNHPMVAVHWPGQYSVETEGFDQATVVPTLSWRTLMPGASGVIEAGRNDQPGDFVRHARMDDERRGGKWVDPWEHAYLKSWEVTSEHGVPGKLWGTIHSTLRAIPGRRAVRIGVDRASLNRWRMDLMEAGYIPRPAREHLQALVDEASAVVDRIRSNRKMHSDVRTEKLEEATARLEAVKGAVERELAASMGAPLGGVGALPSIAGDAASEVGPPDPVVVDDDGDDEPKATGRGRRGSKASASKADS